MDETEEASQPEGVGYWTSNGEAFTWLKKPPITVRETIHSHFVSDRLSVSYSALVVLLDLARARALASVPDLVRIGDLARIARASEVARDLASALASARDLASAFPRDFASTSALAIEIAHPPKIATFLASTSAPAGARGVLASAFPATSPTISIQA